MSTIARNRVECEFMKYKFLSIWAQEKFHLSTCSSVDGIKLCVYTGEYRKYFEQLFKTGVLVFNPWNFTIQLECKCHDSRSIF